MQISFLLIKHPLEQPPTASQQYVLLISSIILTLPVAVIIIVATQEHHILSNETTAPTESPEALQKILREGARELLGVLRTGVGTPNTRRQLLPDTRAGSDGRQSTTKRHHNVNMNVSYIDYQIFMSY